MTERLPADLSALRTDELGEECDRRDVRVSALFQRWPGLSEPEMRELKKLYEERQRLARHLGALRRRRRSASRAINR
jgi:hypothetical protein